MNNFDNWPTYHGSSAYPPVETAKNQSQNHFQATLHEQDVLAQTYANEPSFQLEMQELTLAQHGEALCFATGLDRIVIGTSNNIIINWDIEHGDIHEFRITDKTSDRIHSIFINPTGTHCIISLTSGNVYLLPANQPSKPILLANLRHVTIQSAAWYMYDHDIPKAHAGTQSTQPPIQRVLVGTTNGQLWELAFEDIRERSCKKIFDLSSATGISGAATSGMSSFAGPSITGIRVLRAQVDLGVRDPPRVLFPTIPIEYAENPRWHVLLVTNGHQFKVSGGPTLEALFANITRHDQILSQMELPSVTGAFCGTQLIAFTPSVPMENPSEMSVARALHASHMAQGLLTPSHYGWVTAAGVFLSSLDPNAPPFELQHTSNHPSGENTLHHSLATVDPFTFNDKLLDYPKIVDEEAIQSRLQQGEGIGFKPSHLQPISVVISELHILSLFPQHLSIVNAITGKMVYSRRLPVKVFGRVRALAADESNNTYWLLTDTALYELIIENEQLNAWRLYLQQGDYAQAYIYAETNYQQKLISSFEAEHLFTQGEYTLAAKQYIRSERAFEYVTMRYLLEYMKHSQNSTQLIGSNGSAAGNGSSVGAGSGGSSALLLNNTSSNTTNNDLSSAGNQALIGLLSSGDGQNRAALSNTVFSPTYSKLFGPGGAFPTHIHPEAHSSDMDSLTSQFDTPSGLLSRHFNSTNNGTIGFNHNFFANGGADSTSTNGPTTGGISGGLYTGSTDLSSNSAAAVAAATATSMSSLSLLCQDQQRVGTSNNNTSLIQTTNNTTSTTSNTSLTGTSNSFYHAESIFRSICIQFNVYSGLQTYLKALLNQLPPTEKTKLTTLSSWIVELYVNSLVSLSVSFISPEVQFNEQSTAQFQRLEQERLELYEQERIDVEHFLDDYLDCLHPFTTYHIFTSAGRLSEALTFAKLSGHYEHVLDIYIQQGAYMEALVYITTLRKRKPNTAIDPLASPVLSSYALAEEHDSLRHASAGAFNHLTPPNRTHLLPLSYELTIDSATVHKFLLPLLQHIPSQTVDVLIETDGLSPTQVLIAMVRSGIYVDLFSNESQEIHPITNGNNLMITNGSYTNDSSSINGLIQNSLQQLGINSSLSNAIMHKVNNGVSSTTTATSSSSSKYIISKKTNTRNKAESAQLQHFTHPHVIKSISQQPVRNTSSTNAMLSPHIYLLDITRYLRSIIHLGLAPIAGHNLYVALLIQLQDADTLYSYILAHKHTVYPNRVFAFRLALPHVDLLYRSVIELCLQLQQHTLAIHYALHYDITIAKTILNSMYSPDSGSSSLSSLPSISSSERNGSAPQITDASNPVNPVNSVEKAIWCEYINVMRQNGYSIAQIIADIRHWNTSQSQRKKQQIEKQKAKREKQQKLAADNDFIGAPTDILDDDDDDDDDDNFDADFNLLPSSSDGFSSRPNNNNSHGTNNTLLLQLLSCLPPNTTVDDIRTSVIAQLQSYNVQLRRLNSDMALLHHTNRDIKLQISALQQEIFALNTTQRCDFCSQFLLLSPFIHFRCGHTFHVNCCLDFIWSFLSSLPTTIRIKKKKEVFSGLLSDLLNDLSDIGSQHVQQNDTNDDNVSAISDQQIIQELHDKVSTNSLSQEEEIYFLEEFAQKSCCICGEVMIESIALDISPPSNEAFDNWDIA